jgi:predicted ATPase
MRIKSLKLQNFKRFTDLSLESIPEDARLVVLVGPNGCGKSSVFDAFEQVGGRHKQNFQEDQTYLRKNVDQDVYIEIITDSLGTLKNHQSVPAKHFYIRSAYRIDSDFKTNQIGKKEGVLEDLPRPKRLIDVDKRVQDNYERLVGSTVQSLYAGDKDHLSVSGLREELIGKVRESMLRVFDGLVLEGIGDPFTEGQFFFTKGGSNHFPYKNLSAGEKGAFDLLLDLIIKSKEFDDTVFVIDEPELHMHSGLQQKLLKELYELIPEKCQLWIATHSIGFIKGTLELRKGHESKVCLFDFNNFDFDRLQVLQPVKPSASTVRKMFTVALDDLSQMVTPAKIVFCEGSLQAPHDSSKKDFDTIIYKTVFADEDVLFLSADCKPTAQKAATLLVKILTDSGAIRDVKSIVDRDQLTSAEINAYKSADSSMLFLSRRTIENYLLDSEVIDRYCNMNGIDKNKVTSRLTDSVNDDAKAIQGSVMQQSGYTGSVDDFKKELSKCIISGSTIHAQLKSDLGL